jgi:hypothetical protein
MDKMTVKELIERLSKLPQDYEAMCHDTVEGNDR